MVYPDGVWYAQVRASDVPEIIEEHLVQGRIVGLLVRRDARAPELVALYFGDLPADVQPPIGGARR